MRISKTGHHYSLKTWAEWRDKVVSGIHELFPNPVTITTPCRMIVHYWNTDLKRRDVPAMEDSIFHICEKAGLIEDDWLIRSIDWRWEGYDKENGRATIFLEEI